MDHDQRFKTLLEEFFREFILLFWPYWAKRFDFKSVTWLKQEIYLDPPQGERRAVDLIAKLKVEDGKRKKDWLALIHVEIESRESVEALKPRMADYYRDLRKKSKLPVLPIAVMLNVGRDGLGIEVYKENFGDFRVLHFQYLYVGLPGLDGQEYITSDHVLGVALATLMKLPAKERVELTAQALARLVECKENMARKYLLCECVQAYSPLTKKQRQELDELLVSEPYSRVKAVGKTWKELGPGSITLLFG